MRHILLVDDDLRMQRVVAEFLSDKKFQVDFCASGKEAIQKVKLNEYNTVLLDLKLLDISGIEVLRAIKKNQPLLPVITISGKSDIAVDAVKAVQMGAYDFLRKPLSTDKLLITLNNAIRQYQLRSERDGLFSEIQSQYHLVCQSPAMKHVLSQIKKIAPRNVPVLIQGETGVGKELVAGAIHQQSKRRYKPFVRVNCAAIPNELIESELFGHKKGSFTGAFKDQVGKFHFAHNGTIFLDEIADLHPAAQAKLLRVFENNEIEILGSSEILKVNIRIISATNRRLTDLICKRRFRQDLFFRLNTICLNIPPLRERNEDVPDLARLFIRQSCETHNLPMKEIEEEAIFILREQSWPGNVRELKHVVEKLCIMIDKSVIKPYHVQSVIEVDHTISKEKFAIPLKEARENFEKSHILRVLLNQNCTVTEAAKILGIERSNLQKKMKKYDIRKRNIS